MVGKSMLLSAGLAALALGQSTFSVDSKDAIKKTSSILAYDLMKYYDGNLTGHTPGILPGPPPNGDYYWWEAGAMWGTLIDYWKYTGDSTYNENAKQAMVWQSGDGRDYMPANFTASLGNDDQGFWGMTAMLAAENGFPDPPSSDPQWLALAQAVFNTQADPLRHDSYCNGGMRWQIPLANKGYNYKNSIANGCFFNIGARLARYTGNETYAKYAESTWNWVTGVKFIDADWNIYDGAHIEANCTDINKAQFSYNAGVYLLGLANLYNFTDGAEKWKTPLDKLLNRTINVFFPNKTAYEVACEPQMSCTTDMLSFKGYILRWLGVITRLAPHTRSTIFPVIEASAKAAIKQCTGGENGRQCGFGWVKGTFDGTLGVGQQMNALGAVMSLLVDDFPGPLTANTGGTSVGDVNAGANSDDFRPHSTPMSAGSKAGAAILTIVIIGGALGTFVWMSLGV